MIERIVVLRNIGRFADLTHDESATFRRMTLIRAANGAGKSTLADLLRAAGQEDAPRCERRLHLAARARGESQTVELRFFRAQERSVQRLEGRHWTACPQPIDVYDREYIDENVFLGRQPGKGHRTRLLEIALGSEEVQWQRRLEDLDRTARELTVEHTRVRKLLAARAADFKMDLGDFLALPVADPPSPARAAAATPVELARRVADLAGRRRYPAVPALEARDVERLRAFLERRPPPAADPAEAQIREHLARLGEGGEEFLRRGVTLASGDACPFCGQAAARAWFDHLRGHFDEERRRYLDQVDQALRKMTEQTALLAEVRRAADLLDEVARADADGLAVRGADRLRAALSRCEQRSGLAPVSAALRAARALGEVGAGEIAAAVDATHAWNELAAVIGACNAEVVEANARLERHLAQQGADVDRDLDALLRPRAALARREPQVVELVRDLDEMEARRIHVAAEKKAIAMRAQSATSVRFADFAARLNQLLQRIGADFRVEQLATERGGGKPALRFAIALAAGDLLITDSRSEGAFRELLSDGDRSALAFAWFVLALEERHDLADRILVFDDPMISLDDDRSAAVADILGELCELCDQMIVLSHDPRFLARVAARFCERGGDAPATLWIDATHDALRVE